MVTLRPARFAAPRPHRASTGAPAVADPAAVYPVSKGQERLWTLAALRPNQAAYNLPSAAWLEGQLDESALRASFETVVAQHEILRTSFQLVDETPRQIVHPSIRLPLHFLPADATEPPTDRAAWAQAQVSRLASQPFDLTQAPLFRVEVIPAGPQLRLLVIVIHHALVDGASLGLLIQALGAAYRRKIAGDETMPPPLAAQFGDYARSERAELTGPAAQAKREQWRGYLQGCVPVLALPHDRARPAQASEAGDGVRWSIDPVLGQALKALCREQRTTLYACLLAAMYVLLHRYSGQRDILVGTPALNRRNPRFAGLIGFFANTIVVRAQVEERQTFSELLRHVHEQVIWSLGHEDLPFDEIVRAAGVAPSDHSPLFQVLFQLQRAGAGVQEIAPGLRLAAQPVRNGSSKFDLHVALAEHPSGAVEGCWEFATDRFARATLERMAANFTELLRSVVSRPHAALRHVPLIAASERSALNALGRGRPPGAVSLAATIPAQFAARVAQSPLATAITFEDDQGRVCDLTFRELADRSDRIAAALARDWAVRPGEVVGVCLDRSPALIATLLGILKCGAAYLPVDPTLPGPRRAYVLHDAQAQIVVTAAGAAAPAEGVTAVTVAQLEQAGADAEPPGLAATAPEDAAYVLYTSGSSGRPKGVVLEHRSVVNTLRYLQDRLPVGAGDRYLLKTNVMFDVSVTELFGWFFGDGRLVIVRGDIARDPERIVGAVARHRITHLNFVPSMLTLFCDTLRAEDWAALGGLRHLMVAGEAFGADLVAKLAPLPDSVQVNNLYGPTEAAIYATDRRVRRSDSGAIPIGLPLDGTSAYVVDPQGELVPRGVSGELVLGGAGLARGYLNNPELTHARFTAATPLEEVRVYRTGDLARWTDDGEIDYLGRLDRQVKVRGFRIEIPEVEAHLAAHGEVAAAVVIDRSNAAGQTELWAYCVLREPVTAEVLRGFLAERLPGYMIPGHFVRLAALPMLPSGKVDRGALPVSEALPLERGALVIAPRNALERGVHAAWRDLLGGGDFGVHDDFFSLGGHSLAAVRLANRLNREHAIELPLSVVFHASTVAKLAERIAAAPRCERRVASVRSQGPHPATRAQLRMFVAQQKDPTGTTYNVPQLFEYRDGRLDAGAVRAAFATLLQRHEALRTTFRYEGGEVVAGVADGAFDFFSTRVIERADRERVIREFVRAFDLSRPPLLRVLLAEYRGGGGVLCVDAHHIAVDGISGAILLRELVALYEGAAMPPQPAGGGAWRAEQRDAEVARQDGDYWRRTLADLGGPLCLPIEAARGGRRLGRMLTTELPLTVLTEVRRASAQWSVTPNVFLLAVFYLVLARATGQRDIVVGMPIAGRDSEELDGVVGNFVNTLPLRSRSDGGGSFASFLRHVRSALADGMAHSRFPIDEIASQLRVQTEPGRNPLFDVMFEVRPGGAGPAQLRLRDVELHPITAAVNVAKMDLVTTVVLEERGACCHWHYDAALISAENVSRWAEDFAALAASAAADAERDLASLVGGGAAEPAAEYAGAAVFAFN